MSLSDRIKHLRKEHKWNQTELGKLIGVSTQVVSNWERNYTQPDKQDIYKLAQTFQVTTDYLLGLSNKQIVFESKTKQEPIDLDLLTLLRCSENLKVGDYSLTEDDKSLLKELLIPLAKGLKELHLNKNQLPGI
ncbi:helix-turn-helix domain-containing protein [Paenibacillus agricola]|uniref:Helix-turn-helix domain-containing protein n=1 Tax=Paenibacillus agricola TaxID=2716264 RepID=A0ABX0JBP9_9BACL|nr:helix-turn-helix domain-containing protein [Paenibacillus agricola]NHN31614.1 helix-turn-helix domain-containing protein [Paenibacillus agricola]